MKKKYIIFDFDGTLVNSNTKEFFDGVIEMIEKFSKDYIMFISSRSSEEILREKLKNAGIYEYFDIVFGSSVLEKGPKHIETFKLLLDDDEFENKTIFVGDGEIDRDLAKETGISFVKVGKDNKDYYEIDKITDLENYITKIK